MTNTGFRINSTGWDGDEVFGNPKYLVAVEALEEFAKVFGRKKQLRQILSDNVITSLEIRRDLLDTNADGLKVSDFYSREDYGFGRIFLDRSAPSRALAGLAALFQSRGEDLYSYIADYENDYYATREVCDGEDACHDEYVAPPVAFTNDSYFMTGAVRASAEAYVAAAPELRQGSGINPDFFNQSALAVNPDVIFEVPNRKRRDLFAQNEDLLIYAIGQRPGYYARYATPEQKADVDFNLRAYEANPEVKAYFSPPALADFRTALHGG